MSDDLHIPAQEREVVRLFALDLEPSAATAFTSPRDGNGAAGPLQHALGADTLDPAHVEVISVSDLKGVGLSGYLIDGLGIDAADVTPDTAKLDAESGIVVIVHSAAFQGVEQTLTASAPLRALATYRQAQAEPPRPAIPASPGDPPEITPTASPPPGPPSRSASLLVLGSILFAAILLLAVVFYFRSQPY